MQILYATGGHADTILLGLAARRTLFLYRVAASRMQIVPEWPPVTKKEINRLCLYHHLYICNIPFFMLLPLLHPSQRSCVLHARFTRKKKPKSN
jgi:hypothetical protein